MITFTNISAINLYYPSLVYLFFFCTFGIIFTDIRVITPLLYSGKSVALLITLTPWAWFSDWKDGKLKHRGDDYNALKDKIGHQMWKQTEELFPQLAGTVCYKIFYVTLALTLIHGLSIHLHRIKSILCYEEEGPVSFE